MKNKSFLSVYVYKKYTAICYFITASKLNDDLFKIIGQVLQSVVYFNECTITKLFEREMMKTLKYVFMAALVFLVIKAFYLDRKIAEYWNESNETATQQETAVETNTSPNATISANPSKEQNDSSRKRNQEYYKEAPLEKVGDAVADELSEKIKIPEREMPTTDSKAF